MDWIGEHADTLTAFMSVLIATLSFRLSRKTLRDQKDARAIDAYVEFDNEVDQALRIPSDQRILPDSYIEMNKALLRVGLVAPPIHRECVLVAALMQVLDGNMPVDLYFKHFVDDKQESYSQLTPDKKRDFWETELTGMILAASMKAGSKYGKRRTSASRLRSINEDAVKYFPTDSFIKPPKDQDENLGYL